MDIHLRREIECPSVDRKWTFWLWIRWALGLVYPAVPFERVAPIDTVDNLLGSCSGRGDFAIANYPLFKYW
jgi:hypothetical protein